MKMVMAVFRDSLEDDVMEILKQENVSGYTLVPKVAGGGSSGEVAGSFLQPGFNALLLVAMPDEVVTRVVADVKALHARRAKEFPEAKTMVHVFVWGCEKAL